MSKLSFFKNILSRHMDTRTVSVISNLRSSQGLTLCDVDNKKYVDMLCNIASLPIGYNNPKLVSRFNERIPELVPYMLHRPALSVNPTDLWCEEVDKFMTNYCPRGFDKVYFSPGSGSEAVENALKSTFIYHSHVNHHRAGTCRKQLDKSVMENQYPGAANEFKMMSFKRGFHGRTIGALSTSRSKAIHKLHVPAFNSWITGDFPMIDYNINNKSYNTIIEEKCINQVEKQLDEHPEVIGMIIEPIQSEGGDNHASAKFFKDLRMLAKRKGITFIVDEIQTGVYSTGTKWAYEGWNLGEGNEPDIVIFAKKAQVAGYFYRNEYMPPEMFQIHGTYQGDPFRIVLSNMIHDIIVEDNLIDNVKVQSEVIMNGLKDLKKKYSFIDNIRGKGLHMAYDPIRMNNIDMMNKYIERGINIGSCGDAGIRLRPSLNVDIDSINTFLNVTEDIIQNVDVK
jgi:4-aminobutyrate aminotransferase/(S)-3-amino-2-methylpropionate transaminase